MDYEYDHTNWTYVVKGEPLILVGAHCDNRVLHSFGHCVYCSAHPKAQLQRKRLGVNFTDTDDPKLIPCPARDQREPDHLNAWGGNQPYGPGVTVEEVEHFDLIETGPSRMFYGEPTERHGKGRRWWRRLF